MLLGEDQEENDATRAHRERDCLSDCDSDDALWGFAIRSSSELEKTTLDRVDDPVLDRLFRMGFFDWPGKGKLLGGVLRGIRYSSVLAFRLLGRILQWEQKVLLASSIFAKEGLRERFCSMNL